MAIIKVRITKSNCTFVKVGDVTEITVFNGVKRMWSKRLNSYENLSWIINMWGVEYEEL
ncbi:hypothetical protein SP069_00240 [Salmonella phage SP069]|uniref:Uncharacterized protein n=2 Tax=Nonanavirus TaxID=1921122 RepID=S4TWP6_9CAUD|nr:hypothetical protein QII00_sAgp48 [Salmonella phage SP069]AGF89328.1 hypothetical protein SP062_00240 [Salmonella phage FSL SP-062]AGF89547.1 hypothetical protein SP069_00240 [Salmonella phage SP069]